MDKYFNPAQAVKAQEAYCDEHKCPMYAPRNGICFRCGFNIYLPINGSRNTILGISVAEAGCKLVTSCPFCNTTFVD